MNRLLYLLTSPIIWPIEQIIKGIDFFRRKAMLRRFDKIGYHVAKETKYRIIFERLKTYPYAVGGYIQHIEIYTTLDGSEILSYQYIPSVTKENDSNRESLPLTMSELKAAKKTAMYIKWRGKVTVNGRKLNERYIKIK